MAPPKPAETKRRYFSVEEANKTLPLVRAIVTDIVRQWNTVNELKQRLSAVKSERKRLVERPYSEELAQSQAEMADRGESGWPRTSTNSPSWALS